MTSDIRTLSASIVSVWTASRGSFGGAAEGSGSNLSRQSFVSCSRPDAIVNRAEIQMAPWGNDTFETGLRVEVGPFPGWRTLPSW